MNFTEIVSAMDRAIDPHALIDISYLSDNFCPYHYLYYYKSDTSLQRAFNSREAVITIRTQYDQCFWFCEYQKISEKEKLS